MNICIVGLGNIGSYLYKYILKNKNEIFKKTNVLPNLKYVSARSFKKKRNITISKKKWLSNYLKATKLKDVDIIVELIGGPEGAAKKLVFEALKNNKHVVTANKALISKYGDKLAQLAEKNKVNLEFEAAVCGGVPIVRSLKESLIGNKIYKIFGILNGTSNYILSSMDKNNLKFDNALKNAQKLGYAESNPTSDINGDDVSSKLKILTALSFNSYINNKIINVEGINYVDDIDINNANKLGYKIKLLAISELINNKIIQRVHPCLIKKTSYIANIDNVLNAVVTESYPVGQTVVQGEGAGPEATTSALISDISSILRGNIKFPFTSPDKERKKLFFDNISKQVFSSYFRFDVQDKQGVLSDITSVMAKQKVSIKRLIQNPFKSKKFSSIIVITHESTDKQLSNVIKILKNKKYLIKKPKYIRIENI